VTGFVTPAELSAYTKGAVPESDPRSQPAIDGASEAIRRWCGWNVAPAEDLTYALDGGGQVLYLPTLKLNALTSVVVEGQPVTDLEWSERTGNVRRRDHCDFPDVWGSVEVTFNSGYDEAPADLKQIVLQVVASLLSSPSGATREQVGQVSVMWATTAPGVSGGLSLLARDLEVLAAYRLPREA
jgi:hypothetical protein